MSVGMLHSVDDEPKKVALTSVCIDLCKDFGFLLIDLGDLLDVLFSKVVQANGSVYRSVS